MSVQVPTTVASTARVLREEIVDGRLRPGERLTEIAIAERLRVSRATVREALRSLEARGLVEVQAYLGARVAVLTPDDAVELSRVRAWVEPMLLERFCARASTVQLNEIDEIMLAMTQAARESDDLRRVYRAADAFYEALYAGADSWSITLAVRAEHARLFAYRRSVLTEEVELERLRHTTASIRRLMPLLIRRESQQVGNFSRRAMVEDAAATIELIRARSATTHR